MFAVRRLLRFSPLGFVVGFLLIGIMYGAVLFLLWVAFGDAAPQF